MTRSFAAVRLSVAAGLLLVACEGDAPNLMGPAPGPSARRDGVIVARADFKVALRGGDGGHNQGHVKFHQPVDADLIVYFDTRVRGLAGNTSYLLQRAVDTVVDDDCTSQAWLTLGKGLVPQAITTDDKGRGHEQLFRAFAAASLGSEFDIHFRVVDAATSAVVLSSPCYQFVVSQ